MMNDEIRRQYRVQMLQQLLNDLYKQHDRNPNDYRANIEIQELKEELRRLGAIW